MIAIQTICWAFQTRSNVSWITRFRWKLTYNVSRGFVGFALDEGGFQIDMEKDSNSYLLLADKSYANPDESTLVNQFAGQAFVYIVS